MTPSDKQMKAAAPLDASSAALDSGTWPQAVATVLREKADGRGGDASAAGCIRWGCGPILLLFGLSLLAAGSFWGYIVAVSFLGLAWMAFRTNAENLDPSAREESSKQYTGRLLQTYLSARVGAAGAVVTERDLYAHYRDYLQGHGAADLVVSDTLFHDALKAHLTQPKKKATGALPQQPQQPKSQSSRETDGIAEFLRGLPLTDEMLLALTWKSLPQLRLRFHQWAAATGGLAVRMTDEELGGLLMAEAEHRKAKARREALNLFVAKLPSIEDAPLVCSENMPRLCKCFREWLKGTVYHAIQIGNDEVIRRLSSAARDRRKGALKAFAGHAAPILAREGLNAEDIISDFFRRFPFEVISAHDGRRVTAEITLEQTLGMTPAPPSSPAVEARIEELFQEWLGTADADAAPLWALPSARSVWTRLAWEIAWILDEPRRGRYLVERIRTAERLRAELALEQEHAAWRRADLEREQSREKALAEERREALRQYQVLDTAWFFDYGPGGITRE